MLQVCTRTSEERLPNESFAQEKLDILATPLTRGKRLQKHHDILEFHFDQLVRPLHQKCCTNVEMELRKALLLGLEET